MLSFIATRRGQRNHIYTLPSVGQPLHCLTCQYDLPDHLWELTWVPHSDQLLFAVASDPPDPGYYYINRDGTGLQPFLPELQPRHIWCLSANDNIFFSSYGSVWMVPSGGTVGDCVPIHMNGEITSIAPNGDWLTFQREEYPEQINFQYLGTNAVYTVVLDIPEADHYAEANSIQWSPNSQCISYIANYCELWIYEITTGTRTFIAVLSYFWRQFRWSPDSQHIAYVEPIRDDGPGISYGAIYAVELATGSHRHIVDIRRGTWGWSADSRHILYTTSGDGKSCIYRVDIASKQQHLVLQSESLFDDILSGLIVTRTACVVICSPLTAQRDK